MRITSFLAILILAFGSLQAQETAATPPAGMDQATWEIMDKLEDTIAVLGYAVVNDSLPENRFAATKKLIRTLAKSLSHENSFLYPFERTQSVSIMYPQDSTFRIFSWQLYVDKDTYRYYGAIQRNELGSKLIPLLDRSFQIEDEQKILSPEEWYGAVYYNIRQFDTPRGRKYLLFGYDGNEFFRKRKIVDVLTFNGTQVSFGAPVFHSADLTTGQPVMLNRILLEYSAEAAVSLNWDEALGIIIHDNLIPMSGAYNQGEVNVSDGSYVGYELAPEGYWKIIPKLETENRGDNNPPRDNPILDARKKDVFGKNK